MSAIETTRRDDGIVCSVRFSEDMRSRYLLTRVWEARVDRVAFVGLNPSTADLVTDDPTVRRCMGFARRWGFGGLTMLNLFPFRSTDPRGLLEVDWDDADNALSLEWNCGTLRANHHAHLVTVAAWGAFVARLPPEIVDLATGSMSGQLFHLGLTKAGYPKHPLYLPKTLRPVRWERG